MRPGSGHLATCFSFVFILVVEESHGSVSEEGRPKHLRRSVREERKMTACCVWKKGRKKEVDIIAKYLGNKMD